MRWTAHGVIEYLGRLDQQVKLRGFRVEPQKSKPGCWPSTALRKPWCCARNRGRATADRLLHRGPCRGRSRADREAQSALAAELPEYMVPAQLMRLDAMPLSPSGKLDRRALPEPQWQVREHVEPQTELEQHIAGIWREVLGLARVGLRDDFFALGGHSLLATQIISRTRQACDVDLPLRALFEPANSVRLPNRFG